MFYLSFLSYHFGIKKRACPRGEEKPTEKNMVYQNKFKRYELKFLLSPAQYAAVLNALNENGFRLDDFGKTLICNVYYDTPDLRYKRGIVFAVYGGRACFCQPLFS